MNPRVKRLIDMEKMKQEHDLGIGSNLLKINFFLNKNVWEGINSFFVYF